MCVVEAAASVTGGLLRTQHRSHDTVAMWSCCGQSGADYCVRHHPSATTMSPAPNYNHRASSLGPLLGLTTRKHQRSLRDQCLYECNYESIDTWSSGSNDSASASILKLESSVKSVDSLIGKQKQSFDKRSDKSSKIQYDSITVLPPPPPPPLPRTRSFKHYRARTVHPWASASQSGAGARASSAPPISPLHQRKLYAFER